MKTATNQDTSTKIHPFATEVSSFVSTADSDSTDGSPTGHENDWKRTRSFSILDLNHDDELLAAAALLSRLPSILKVKTQHASFLASLSSLDNEAKAANNSHAQSVSFGELRIREYACRPSANPGCRGGVSLELEWEIQDETSVQIEDYEACRPRRRDRGELNIPPEVRMQMMLQSGFSRAEIMKYIKMANIARGQRNRTNETHQLAKAEELAQKIVRGVRNKTLRRGQKKKEKAALHMSLQQDKKLALLRFSQRRSSAVTVSDFDAPSSSSWDQVPEQPPALAVEDEDSSIVTDDENEPLGLISALPAVEIEC